MTAQRRAEPKYRVNRVGDPVVDRPRATRTSSPAREKYKAARYARRHPAAVAAQVIAGARPPVTHVDLDDVDRLAAELGVTRPRTGDDVIAELFVDARDSLRELLGPLPTRQETDQ